MHLQRLAIRRNIDNQISLVGRTATEKHGYVAKVVLTVPAEIPARIIVQMPGEHRGDVVALNHRFETRYLLFTPLPSIGLVHI
ncbi:hypothetical protein D3C84_894560 [compost metagenome]